MKTLLEIVDGALALLSRDEAWTQDVFAADSEGSECSIESEYAVCFCLDGALRKAAGLYSAWQFPSGLPESLGFRSFGELHDWNDAAERTHAEVVERLKQARSRLAVQP